MKKEPITKTDPSNYRTEGNTFSFMGPHKNAARAGDFSVVARRSLQRGLHPGGEPILLQRPKTLMPETTGWKMIL
jgi:hypothetical protein